MINRTTRNVAIVAFTRTGITRRLCGMIATQLMPDMAHYVEPYKNYTGAIGALRGVLDMLRKRDPVVYPPKPDLHLEKYDLVIVATPVWAGQVASPLKSFLRQHGQGAKKTALLITHSSSDACAGVFDELDELLGVKRSYELSVCSIKGEKEQEVEAFAETLLQAVESQTE